MATKHHCVNSIDRVHVSISIERPHLRPHEIEEHFQDTLHD